MVTRNGRECPLPPPDMTIENAQFIYKTNFEGREEGFNDEGDRMFNVIVPDNILEKVTADNWNITWSKPGKNHPDPDSFVPQPFIKVSVGFTYRPPTIIVNRDGHETQLTAPSGPKDPTPDTVKLLDAFEFEAVHLTLRGRAWENETNCGIKAWLKTFYGFVKVDDVLRKYSTVGVE